MAITLNSGPKNCLAYNLYYKVSLKLKKERRKPCIGGMRFLLFHQSGFGNCNEYLN